MRGPKPSGKPRRKPFGMALRPSVLEQMDELVATFQRIEAQLSEEGVALSNLPTTRSALGSWFIEDGVRQALHILKSVERIRTKRNDADDIALVETSPLWHYVLHFYPRNLPFPPPPAEAPSESPASLRQEKTSAAKRRAK